MRRVKIVATLGPASASREVIAQLIEAGVDVIRLNFSHGDHEWHRGVFASVRACAEQAGRHIAILCDLQGPKIRFGTFPDGVVYLERGQEFVISGAPPTLGDQHRGHCTYKALPSDVKPGAILLGNDGLLVFKVVKVKGSNIVTKVEVGGPLSDRKGLNAPGVRLTTPAVTDKDRRDLDLALELGADIIAVSFVRSAADLYPVKERVEEAGSKAWVIAKIEKPQAVKNFAKILPKADGIMIARGDLGVELPPERVPALQKELIAQTNRLGKPVITATQMLESMTVSPRPTRAEVSDVANAVNDGTDAVMLSGETASGKYPIRVVEMMARIVRETERSKVHPFHSVLDATVVGNTGAAIATSVVRASEALKLDAIVLFTLSGYTARLVSNARPRTPVLALTRYPDAARRLSLLWGVRSMVVEFISDFDSLVQRARSIVAAEVPSKNGHFALLAGVPLEERRTTNLMCLLEY